MGNNMLVNSIYPVSYFSLPGVDTIQYPDQFWWSSKQRFASVQSNTESYLSQEDGGVLTSEILEIDLGRIREINYINLDVLRAPIDIFVEYDIVSAPDRETSWVSVQPQEELPFDNRVVYDADNKTGWYNADLFFTDPNGYIVHARYLRITFRRRDERWPLSTSSPFKWPVFVKHLRLGRYIAQYADTVGPLLTQDTPADLTEEILDSLDATTSREIRQKFVVPPSSLRGNTVPNILGFGLLIKQTTDVTDFGWALYDVTIPDAPSLIRNGTVRGAITGNVSWRDWYLEEQQVVIGDVTRTFELRIYSRDIEAWDTYYTTNQHLSLTALPGTLDFTLSSNLIDTSEDLTSYLAAGDWIESVDEPSIRQKVASITTTQITAETNWPSPNLTSSANKIYPFTKWNGVDDYEHGISDNASIVMRVWADIADEGRDVLGNAYRYGVRRDLATYATDRTQAGWMSDPVPSADAVEALYFDVRDKDPDTSEFIYRLIDGMRVAPRTPGVRMNIYSSREALDGDAPETVNEWDNLLWTPVAQNSFILRRNHLIDFPTPIRASYIKLEFTALNPLPWRIPNFPPLPPKKFRRFPTWVEDQFTNSALRNVIEDWFLRTATPVQIEVLESYKNPVFEFEYKEREFLAALALGKVKSSQLINQGLVNVDEKSVLDPTTGSKVWVYDVDQYHNSLLVSVDQNSVLGKAVVARFDPNVVKDPLEHGRIAIPTDAIPTVSSVNNRITESYSHLANMPMRFNRTARHTYREDMAEFNKKAFFVGIDEVTFLRAKYEQKHDDEVITISVYETEFMEESTWSHEYVTSIPDGATVYVSYRIDEIDYEDEPVVLGLYFPITLAGKGGDISNIRVYQYPDEQGLAYFNGDDYVVSQGFDADGVRIYRIARTTLTERLSAPEQTIYFIDAGVVTSRGLVPDAPSYDAGVAIGQTVITAEEALNDYTFGEGEYGAATGTYERLTDV